MAERKQIATAGLATMVRPYTRILQSRRYRPLWIGQVVSNLGDTFHYIALVVLLFRLTGSGATLAALALAQITVTLAVGPVAGVIIDRLDRRIMMIAADVVRAALAIALAFTASAPLAIILAVAMAAAGVVFNPAARALLPSLVEEDALLAANTVGWTTEQATQILAAAGAGGLLLAYGTTPAFLFNAATFVFSAFMLLRLPSRLRAEAVEKHDRIRGFWSEAGEGLRYARRDPFVRPLLLVQGLASFATGGTSALLVVLSSQHLHVQPGQFSWLLLVIGVGALIGPFLLPRLMGADARLVFWPYVWRGIGDILLGLLIPLPVALVILVAYGIGTSTGAVTYSTVVQQHVPDAVRGRVFATLDVVWATGEIASIGFAGFLADRVGIAAVYIAGGAILTLAGVIGLVRVVPVTAIADSAEGLM